MGGDEYDGARWVKLPELIAKGPDMQNGPYFLAYRVFPNERAWMRALGRASKRKYSDSFFVKPQNYPHQRRWQV